MSLGTIDSKRSNNKLRQGALKALRAYIIHVNGANRQNKREMGESATAGHVVIYPVIYGLILVIKVVRFYFTKML